ncbi:MAG TPA: Gfo/Idh/MocA family oxidoreductase [Pyrinomonadaceae bacterium]|nr:Gfo/Idh/MocA family oxidoreductase [Pyrinomonadaceae bacterium]
MIDKVRWGVLGVANIATKKVIPAMQAGEWSTILGIASRDLEKAETAAANLGIQKSYASYQDLLDDDDIEAVYIPLPNHLHVEWAIKAAEAGKHVLCEKPISLSVAEALPLLDVRESTGVKIQEAFMVQTHPQWIAVMNLIRDGRIGAVRSVIAYFSYNNQDPKNIRNIRDIGGGGLMDIGCYLIFCSRQIFGAEPRRIVSLIEEHPLTHTDILTSALLDFEAGQSVFTCSTRITPYQRVQIIGTDGRIEVQIPFNAPPDRPCKIFIDDGSDLSGAAIETIEFAVTDQYTIQGDLFSQAIREESEPVLSLEDSIRNMAAIETTFKSMETGRWETVPQLFTGESFTTHG